MDNLLDTHTFIWFVEGDAQLSENARHNIEKKGVDNFGSVCSLPPFFPMSQLYTHCVDN